MLSQESCKRQQELMLKDQELQQLYTDLQEEHRHQGGAAHREDLQERRCDREGHRLEESLQLVLVRSQAHVLYANPKLDLTNRVIVAYDKKHP
jgi:outer membrane protein